MDKNWKYPTLQPRFKKPPLDSKTLVRLIKEVRSLKQFEYNSDLAKFMFLWNCSLHSRLIFWNNWTGLLTTFNLRCHRSFVVLSAPCLWNEQKVRAIGPATAICFQSRVVSNWFGFGLTKINWKPHSFKSLLFNLSLHLCIWFRD